MTIYAELVQRVSEGESFYIDFEKRTLKIGKEKIVDKGEYDGERKFFTKPLETGLIGILKCIEILYEKYKFSLPSERSNGRRKKYFKALPIEEIPDEQLMVAERREVARAKLEGFILCMILDGQFIWDEPFMGKWFYQSKHDPDLVILKKWIENK